MRCALFDGFPSPDHTRTLLCVCLVLFPIMMVSVNYAFALSRYPVSFMESQLSFSGEEIKSHFALMNSKEIEIYTFAQFVDYLYIIVYSLLIFSFGIFLGRFFPVHSKKRCLGYSCAIFGLIAGLCDIVENLFILLMSSDPIGFPTVYAVIHSFFASIKFAFLGFSICLILLLLTLYLITQYSQNRKR